MRTSRRGQLLRTAAFTSLLLATPALSQVPEGPFFTASGTRTASYMDAYNSWLAANVVPTQEMILGVNPSPFVSIEGDATKPNYNGDGATGPASIAIGQEAQATQASSLAIGTRARSLGERSVAIGVNANAAGSSSVIVGPSAGVNYTGTRSVGIGDSALNNAKGDNNLALGASAGADSDGTRNTSVGALNAGAGLRGDLNASFGFASAYNTTGSHNTSTGAYSGQNSSGDNNVSVGSNSGRFINGNNNTAVGYLAGNGPSINNRRNLTGATALGAGAQATSNYSIAIGAGEVDATTGNLTVPGATASGTNAIAIGRNSRTNAANTVVVGNAAQANSVQSTALGYQAISEGREGVVIGANAGTGTTTASNTQIAVGSSAGQRVDGLNSTAIGFQSGRDVVGNNNLAMGTRSGQNVTGSRNVVAGWESGQGVRGNNNLALGPQSGNNVNGFFNAAQGYWSGVGVQGSYNIAQGSGAGAYVVGSNNVAIGNRAGTNASAIESPSNGQPLFADTTTLNVADTIAIGSASLSSANFGIALGAGARANNVNSVALGANASTDAAVGTATGAIGTTTTTFAGTAPVGTLSIGSAGSERTLTNLAAGRVTADSTDAVNGSQLYATNQVVANNSTAIGTLQSDALQWDEGIGAFNAARATNATNKITNVTAGELSATSTDAVNGSQLFATNQNVSNLQTTINNLDALTVRNVSVSGDGAGNGTNWENEGASGANAIAIGHNAAAPADDSTYIGANAGSGALVTNWRTTAVGSGAGANSNGEDNSFLGYQAGASGAGSNNVGLGDFALNETQGFYNVAVGSEAGRGVVGDANVAVGVEAGMYVDGAGNIALGSDAGKGSSTDRLGMNYAISLGDASLASADHAVAVGRRALASAASAMSFGLDANASGVDSLAMGRDTTAGGTNAIAVGQGAQALGTNSLAIGTGNIVSGDNSGAIGDPSIINASNAYSVGNNNTIGAGADNSFVLGNDVNIAAGISGATALGNASQVNVANGVALGSGSVSDAAVATTGTTLQGTSYTFAGTAPTSSVSIGSAGNERTLTNVAAGRLDATSTDAVNGSQLYATNQALNNLSTTSAAGWNISADGANGTAVGTGSATGNSVDLANTDGNIVVAKTGSSNDVTFDLSDDVTIANSVSVGGNVINAAGATFNTLNAGGGQFVVNNGGAYYTGPITDDNHVVNKAYVDNSIVAASGDVNIGFAGNEGGVVRRTNGQDVAIVGEATTDGDYAGGNLRTVTDAATGAVQLQMAEAPRFGNVTINDGGTGRITGVTAAVLSNTSTHAVNGSQLVALGDSFAAAFGGNSAYDPTTNSFTARIAIGDVVYNNVQDAIQAAIRTAGGGGNGGNGGWSLNTGATGSGVVNNSNPATIAPGGSATFTAGDNIVLTQNGSEVQVAVNRNLNNMESISIANGPTINANGIDMNNRRITNLADGVDPGDAVNMRQFNAGLTDTLNKANVYTDNAINRLGGQLADIRRDANGGTAAAMAMGTLPQAYQPGANVVGMGVSTWDGEQALAVGYSRATSDGRYVLRASGTYNTRSQGGAAIGIGYQW